MIFRTDLAKEAYEGNGQLEGIISRDIILNGIKGSCVEVISDEAAKKIGKRKGKYISFESDALIRRNVAEYENISRAIAGAVNGLLHVEKSDTVLVAGIGNENMTPDSVGPKVVGKTFVTRHIFEFLPDEADERMHSVCALAPGVLGVTGIESADIISGICKKADVGAVIVIDALAARRSERMFSTFQLTDTGIEPGAGVGNKRSELNEATLGIPVIAIGVPTVVYASSLVYDAAVKMLISATGGDENAVENAAREISQTQIGDMVVTPKEIDVIADDSAKVIADGINLALHSGMTLEEINAYMF